MPPKPNTKAKNDPCFGGARRGIGRRPAPPHWSAALLVAIGAGAALSGLVSAFPQLVWLSEHKTGLFGFAGVALFASGALQWHNRYAACPIDPALRSACLRTRRVSLWTWTFSVLV